MSDKLSVEIIGKNSASPAFQAVARDAQQMGTTVEQSGQRAARSFDDFNRKAAALGAGIATVTGVLSDWSRAAADDQAEQARLQQAIENTGKSYSNYSKAVDQAIATGQKKAFTDTQIRDALVSLTAVTNDAGASLNQLGLVEDFARARGIDLATSAEIIAKVMGGNLGILSRYGIQLDKNATSEQALARIQQISAGQADTYANSTKGWLEEVRIKVDETTEAWGYQLGSMQKILALMPGMSAGYTAIAGALTGIGGFSGLANAAVLGTQIAGAGALGTIAYGYAKDDVGSTFANDLANKIFLVMSGLLNAAIPGSPFDTQKYVDQMSKNSTWDQILSVFGSPSAAGSALHVPGTTTTVAQVNDIGGAHFKPGDAGYKPDLTVYTPPSDEDVYNAIVNAAAAGNMTVAQYLASSSVRVAAIGAQSTYQTSGYTSPIAAIGMPAATTPPPWFAYWLAHGSSTAISMFGSGDNARPNLMAYHAGGSGAVANDLYAAAATPGAHNAAVIQAAQAAATDSAMAMVQATAAAIKQYAPGLGITLPQAGVGGVVDNRAGMAARAGTADNAAASGFQVAVGNTNAVAAQVKGVNDWATSLINVRGQYGEIDRLLAKGIITTDEYNRAQSAETSILHSNYDIQNDIMKVQTDQAPIIAQLTNEQQKYWDHIANDLTPAQQQLALAYMDTGEQAKANTALTLAAAAANGQLGDIGTQTATNMITAAAEADPYLKSMLVDMGLITVGADGTITVNFDDVQNGDNAMQTLIGSVQSLVSLIAQTLLISIDLNDNGALAEINAIEYALNAAAGTYQANFIINTIGGNSPGGPQFSNRLGGVAGYASGGVVIRAGEAGIEGLNYPNGSYGLAMTDGLYNVPRGTYVDTAPATKGKVGIGGMTFHNANFYFSGFQSQEQVSRQIDQFALGGSR